MFIITKLINNIYIVIKNSEKTIKAKKAKSLKVLELLIYTSRIENIILIGRYQVTIIIDLSY